MSTVLIVEDDDAHTRSAQAASASINSRVLDVGVRLPHERMDLVPPAVQMPGMDGITALERLRAEGCDGYLEKPIRCE